MYITDPYDFSARLFFPDEYLDTHRTVPGP